MDRRLFIARTVFPLIFFGFYIFACHQLFRFTDFSLTEMIPLLLWVAIPFLMFMSLPFLWTKRRAALHASEKPDESFEKIQLILFFGISYLSYLFALIIGRDIVAFISHFAHREFLTYDRNEAYTILAAPIALLAAGNLVIRRGPQVKKVTLSFANLPDEWDGFKIAQLSDIHIGPLVQEKFLNKVVSRTNKLDADIVVLTGDIIDADPRQHTQSIQKLNELQTKQGVFYIPGNHEYYWNIDNIQKALAQQTFTSLFNETFILEGKSKSRIALSGATDPAAIQFAKPGPALQDLATEAAHADFKILLIHQPNAGASARGFDLQLSGHTHGGQFVPWSLVIKLFQKYAKGTYKTKSHTIYVNQGTGFWGPPDRLGTSCEITEITLKKSHKA